MTPHTLRHTFCANLGNAGMNPKALQYTLNDYAHATYASARTEMERLAAKMPQTLEKSRLGGI